MNHAKDVSLTNNTDYPSQQEKHVDKRLIVDDPY